MSEMGDLSIASFEEAVARIVVPESRIFSPSSTEFKEASITFTTLVDAYAGTVFQVHARPDGSSNAMEEDGSGTTLAIPTPSRRELKLRLPRPRLTPSRYVRRGPFACSHCYGDSRPSRNSEVPRG